MLTSAFDFTLPDDLIAQHPVEPRDRARLMVIRRHEGRWEHRTFAALPELLEPGDVLVRGLALDARRPPSHRELARALDGADLVVADNICSLPMNRAGGPGCAPTRTGQ